MINIIGYVSKENPFIDRRAWSGSRFKIREAIEKAGYEVVWIPFFISKKKENLIKYTLKLRYGRGFDYNRHPWYLKECAKSLDSSLIEKCDALFFPGGAQIMEFCKSEKPVIYYTDANYHCICGYYGPITNKNNVKFGDKFEGLAIQHCSLMIHASQWSADSAESYFGCDPKKNFILEFGANLDDKDIVKASVYNGGQLNILFSGVDWFRKGAPQAIAATKILNERGIKAKLYFCGINTIPQEFLPLPDCVENYGFLNKNIKEQYDRYISIIKKCHLFLLPTSAECAGIVFSEASAYGLPIFTYNTGGIGNYVKDGVNGYKLSLESTANEFADAIMNAIERGELSLLSEGGVKLFEERLSWNAWSRNFRQILEKIYG